MQNIIFTTYSYDNLWHVDGFVTFSYDFIKLIGIKNIVVFVPESFYSIYF